MSWGYFSFRPYVSVAERRRNALREMDKLRKKGQVIRPIQLEGRMIARTFWGNAWCDNLESYMDYENRLPRGRTYVRNGSVVHLDIRAGEIEAIVSGSELYKVKISMAPAAKTKWKRLCQECAGGIGSLIELLQGRFSDQVMGIITRKETGLFPAPAEIKLNCSCPDWATMCKHVAAVLYGVGARLDQNPELLFVLRSVNHEELISQAAGAVALAGQTAAAGPELTESEIGSVFGIELDAQSTPSSSSKPAPAPVPAKPARRAPRRPARQAALADAVRKARAAAQRKTAATRKKSAARKKPSRRPGKAKA